ncbi:MAG: hypothetical protein A3B99_03410 [Candidatus Yanofskybacteria bacterium RIFCSPHIGHO2_02_FULL_44_12b]|uniref:Uncharacterized protein n=2 Tax=Candidatus Yanofskyibacteriota TaxID=1752733 RepID=A0A1F8GNU6_9BACT|nr:MAG: hypothetical protein UW79_C0017G0013 [Candidatus Yanofskybacteria bacterium GW2011_GWA2_44_9]OGN05021.1 MAG: hypothetical protein A2659_02610 [Candidatus Yanofskybacteria bacterium RIFCSPHIGHO2_01_FULL_44_24]OGN13972.1 MAG: hypothetical protein A3B99_03410 [Candidatus Yanofskybacteria bacterium RIFCSPHIGHO2_02_FULL_44_12b]OGN26336.1 MAG: hypothetical protein A2925_00385 [Candidatus Yanofskybacteria bacterium RIFCSPLOWO2_01_FULL_44_22]
MYYQYKNILATAVIVAAFVFFVANVSSAAWNWGDPIIPQCNISSYDSTTGKTSLQKPCTQCHLLELIQNLIDFVTKGLMPVLGTLFFIIGGFFILLGGANPSMVQQGKSIMWSTTMGIVIILVAWLITNTIIISLIGGTAVQGYDPTKWFQFNCTPTSITPVP